MSCSHSFPRRQNITLADEYLVVWFNSVFRALEHFGVLSEELEKLGGARTFGAFLLKILPLSNKDNRKHRRHSSIYIMIISKILTEFPAVAGTDVVCLSLSNFSV